VITFGENTTQDSPIEKIARYAKEVFLAAYGTGIVAMLLSMLVIFIGGPRMSAARWIDPPYSPIAIIVSVGSAYFVRRRTHRRPNMWVWIFPAVILVYNLFTWGRYPGQINYWTDVWENFFGSGCGSSECLYELTVTAPVVCSVAYSIAAIFLRAKQPAE
jgi:hypothetical protein